MVIMKLKHDGLVVITFPNPGRNAVRSDGGGGTCENFHCIIVDLLLPLPRLINYSSRLFA